MFYYFMAEGLHLRYSGICKRGINFLPEKDIVSCSGRNPEDILVSGLFQVWPIDRLDYQPL